VARVAGRRAPGVGLLRRRDAVLFVLAAALSAVTIGREIGPHDEGLMLQFAARIADGQLPYRDFWMNYAPGQAYVLGALDAVFGHSLMAWRVLRVVLDAAVAVFAYRLARREASEPLALGAWLAVAGAMAWPTGPGPNPPALALALGALLLAPRRPRLAGALAGLACVFRVEIGAAAVLGVLLGTSRRSTALAMSALIAILGWAPFVIAAPGAVYDQTIGFLGIQGLQRTALPLDPSPAGGDPNKLLELWMPAILVVGLALWALRSAQRGRLPRTALALAPLALVGLAYLLGRTDEFHLIPLAAVLPVLLAIAAARERTRWARLPLIAFLALIALHGLDRKGGQILHQSTLAAVPGPAGDGVRVPEAEAQQLRRVIALMQDLTPRGGPVLVVPSRVDRVTVGNPLLYVLADRRNPTRYDVMQPGVVTTAKVQREMVRDLERARPRLVVRWHDRRTAPEDNASGRLRGSRLLDRWIDEHYAPRSRIGVYEVLSAR
jgi:hypothetical protein